jgi:tRNA(fMet)-specific endonuclease VapC
MVILDSDTLTWLHGNHPHVVANVQSSADPDIRTTIITRIEIVRGRFEALLKAADAEQFLRAQSLLLRSEALLARTLIVRLDRDALRQFERLQKLKGLKKIGRADLLIASIALARNATLASRNRKDFGLVPGLKLVNWVD